MSLRVAYGARRLFVHLAFVASFGAFAAPAVAKEIHVLAFGDSLTTGYGLPQGQGFAPPNLGPQFGAEFNAIFPDVARRHGADLYPFFLANVAGVRSLNLADGVHPNFQGIKRMVTGILPSVLTALRRED